MRRFRLINLFLSSLLALIQFACSPVNGYKFVRSLVVSEKDVQPVINKDKALLYKAKIKLYNKRYSGLILLKQTDLNTSHLTFVTEIGMKMFDFEIQNNSLKLVYIFEPLNKPKIINLLASDMKLILLQHLLNKEAQVYEKKDQRVYKVKEDLRYYYKLKSGTPRVSKAIKKSKIFTKVKVNYFYGDSLNADKIMLKHSGLIPFKMQLNKINNSSVQ